MVILLSHRCQRYPHPQLRSLWMKKAPRKQMPKMQSGIGSSGPTYSLEANRSMISHVKLLVHFEQRAHLRLPSMTSLRCRDRRQASRSGQQTLVKTYCLHCRLQMLEVRGQLDSWREAAVARMIVLSLKTWRLSFEATTKLHLSERRL